MMLFRKCDMIRQEAGHRFSHGESHRAIRVKNMEVHMRHHARPFPRHHHPAALAALLLIASTLTTARAEPSIASQQPQLRELPKISLLADCYDDCTVRALPGRGQEHTIVIMKGNEIVGAAAMPVSPGIIGMPEHMPPGGTGAITVRAETRVIDERGQLGTVIAKDTWTYVNYLVRSVSVEREFVRDELFAGGG
jgi:hypothetical protein